MARWSAQLGWHIRMCLPSNRGVSQKSAWIDGWMCERECQAVEAVHQKDISAIKATLRACARSNDLDRGSKLHDHILQQGLLDECADALVTMYARCGAIARAIELFDTNKCRDALTWTAIVAAHAQKGEGQEALNYFDQMQKNGLFPNAVTFTCALKACGSLRAVEKGVEIHDEIAKQGLLGNNIKLGTALVSMYAKCGALAKAREVLNELPAQDVVSWNAIIGGYIEHQEGEQALNCFEQMQQQGLSPDSITFASMLRACGSIRDLERGEKIYDKICKIECFQKDIIIGNALVDMYANCGALVKARKVFENLPSRNVLSWNILIAAFAEQGEHERAWKYFKQMQREGLSPTAATFHSILKAYGSMRMVDDGGRIHDEMAKQGLLQNNLKLATAVVNMYVKCGAFAKAKQAFEELPARDVFSWNALISGYADHGKGEEALKSYEKMTLDGVPPDEVTFACILKACGITKAIDKGKNFHDEIEKRGWLQKSLTLGNALVSMYSKCGGLEKARQVLEDMTMRNVVSWNALIAGYMEHGKDDKALQCFQQLQDEGLIPDAATYACILRVYGSMRVADKGEQLHHKIAALGFLENDIVLGSALIYMYAMCGALENAHAVFMELPKRNVVSCNALIAGYVEHGKNNLANECFEKMQDAGFSPDAVTYGYILKVCGMMRATGRGQKIHNEIARQGLLANDVMLGNMLVDMYAKCGALVKAKEVLNELPVRNLISWNALITGYIEHGKNDQALHCFDLLQSEGLLPDTVTFTCLLKACGNMGALVKGEGIVHEIAKQGLLKTNLVLGTAVVDMYSQCGAVGKAKQVLEDIPVRNVVTWNTLIAGFVEHEKYEEALASFEGMQCEGVLPDSVTYNLILKGCGNMVAAGMGEKIHERISKQGLLEKDIALGTALLHMYVSCGSLSRARQVLEELPVRDTASWNALLGGFNKQGDCVQALICFDQMLHDGVIPDSFTFSSVLSACSRLGQIEDAECHFASMSAKYGLQPDIEHFTCMVDVFGRAGYLDKATGLIERMPFGNSEVFLVLLNACMKWGDITVGRRVFESALEQGKAAPSMYAIMEKMYMAAGMQEDAEKITAMRILGKT